MVCTTCAPQPRTQVKMDWGGRDLSLGGSRFASADAETLRCDAPHHAHWPCNPGGCRARGLGPGSRRGRPRPRGCRRRPSSCRRTNARSIASLRARRQPSAQRASRVARSKFQHRYELGGSAALHPHTAWVDSSLVHRPAIDPRTAGQMSIHRTAPKWHALDPGHWHGSRTQCIPVTCANGGHRIPVHQCVLFHSSVSNSPAVHL